MAMLSSTTMGTLRHGMLGQLDNICISPQNKEISNMMFTFRLTGVYTTRNAQMSFQKEV